MITRSCDGCGVILPNGSNARGSVKKRDYCGNCVKVVDSYLEARDEIHDAAVGSFFERLQKAKSDALASMGEGAKLPDTLDAT